MQSMASAHGAMGHDPAGVEGRHVARQTIRRATSLARPYRAMLIGLVVVLLLGTLASLVPPLLFRSIIDDAIPAADRGRVNVLAGIIVGAAFAEAGLSFIERWWSSRIGEGLIYDLRVGLYDHVQRMPMAFFTHVQTGSLISRMNNDVIGAQRAFTGTLNSVVSNAIALSATLVTMLVLEWRLTLLALALLPVFIAPTKRVGRQLQALTRQGMAHNAAMNTVMTERLNVAGALLVKLFGRHGTERDEFSGTAQSVRDIGVRSALWGRAFFVALSLVGAVGAAVLYWVGAHLVISGSLTIGTLAAMGLMVVSIYTPLTSLTNARVDVMTALVSFERVFAVLDLPNPITDRPGAVDLSDVSGRIELRDVTFAYPPADDQMLAELGGAPATPQQPSGAPATAPATQRHRRRRRAQPRVHGHRTGPDSRASGPLWRRKDDARGVVVASLRRRQRCRAHRRSRRPRPHAGVVAGEHRHRLPRPPPVPRHHRRKPPLRPTRSNRRRTDGCMPGRRRSTS